MNDKWETNATDQDKQWNQIGAHLIGVRECLYRLRAVYSSDDQVWRGWTAALECHGLLPPREVDLTGYADVLRTGHADCQRCEAPGVDTFTLNLPGGLVRLTFGELAWVVAALDRGSKVVAPVESPATLREVD